MGRSVVKLKNSVELLVRPLENETESLCLERDQNKWNSWWEPIHERSSLARSSAVGVDPPQRHATRNLSVVFQSNR